MKSVTALTSRPAISPLIDDDQQAKLARAETVIDQPRLSIPAREEGEKSQPERATGTEIPSMLEWMLQMDKKAFTSLLKKEKHILESETPLTTRPAISTLVEDDPFFARMREHHQSIVRRAYELFKDTGFSNRHDLEEWQRAVFEMQKELPVQITEFDEGISIRAQVPGFSEEELEVKLDHHRLFIAGRQEKASESEEEKDESACAERNTKEFYSEYLLPADIDPKKATAELKDGVLEIHLPKSVNSIASKVLGKSA
jgi:HSP20 family protein